MRDDAATMSECLRVHGELTALEIDDLHRHWRSLETRLRGFGAGDVTLDLHVKDRDGHDQHLTLEAKIRGWPLLVATTSEPDFDRALNVVRDEMNRLVSDAKAMHRPGRSDRIRTGR